MPNEFYHSTARYESTLISDNLDIKANLETVFKDNFKHSHNSDTVISKDNNIFDINSFSINFIEVKDNGVQFTWSAIYRNNSEDLIGFLDGIGTLNRKHYFSDTCTDGSIQYLIHFCSDSADWNQEVDLHDVFPNKVSCRTSGFRPATYCTYTTFPDTLVYAIVAYEQGFSGFPSYSTGHFDRMIYLSAVTITTLGLGDILPLTKKARLLIAFESIWGIVIIGLFINFLTNKRK